MMLLCKIAAAVLVAVVLTLLLKKDQPAFAFLVSVCTAAGLLAVVVRQVQPLLDWLRTLDVYFQGQSPAVLLQVLGIALVAQLAADTCKEAGLSAAATAIELCGRVLALLQATCRKQGRTVIVITHNSALAAMADRVIRINSGRVVDQTVNPNPTPVERIEW